MPFDPNLPIEGTEMNALEMRGQFNGLKDLIDTISGVTSVVVDSVTTLPAGSQATVNLNLVGTVLHFSFGIPQGAEGGVGATGPQGQAGVQGPPFANAVVDGVNTLNPGEPATVGVNFDGTNVRFTFGIPRGNDGATGPAGPNGEVSQVDLNNAISGTSANSNAVATLDTPFADPEAEALRQAYNALVLALRR